jgi:hypothetical protein
MLVSRGFRVARECRLRLAASRAAEDRKAHVQRTAGHGKYDLDSLQGM